MSLLCRYAVLNQGRGSFIQCSLVPYIPVDFPYHYICNAVFVRCSSSPERLKMVEETILADMWTF